MNQIHTFISLYFNLSRKEANGFIILCFLIPIFIFMPWIGRLCFSSAENFSKKDQHTMNSLLAQMENHRILEKNASQKAPIPKKENIPGKFNPNMATEMEMIHAGVPDYTARRIVKFRSKGGTFHTKEDFKKIYGVSENLYQKLSPYIMLPTSSDHGNSYTVFTNEKKKTIQPFDLNKADSLTLVLLKGIGPTLAARILKYRLRLGGFISTTQLRDVYGLDSLALKDLYSYGYIDQNFIPVKIDLNSSDEKTLSNHPYIGKKLASIIANYRSMHGNFTSPEQLRNIKSISEQAYLKIVPYLK